jgi:hypothetical protein
MCEVYPAGKGWNASLIVRYTSSLTLEITQPSGSTTRTSSCERLGRGVVRCEDPHVDVGREGGGVETQWLTQHHGVQAVVRILFAGLLEHTLGDVYPHEALVAEHAKNASEHAGACAGIWPGPPEWDIAPREASRHGGYRVAQAQHIVFIMFRPLVLTALQLVVIAGRVHVL